MGKIKLLVVLTFFFLIFSLLPLLAQEGDYSIESLERNAITLLQQRVFDLKEDSTTLTLTILSLEIDDALFSPKRLVESDIIITTGEVSVRRTLSFLVEKEDTLSVSYIENFKDILPFVLNSLYSFESDPYRLYYGDASILSAKRIKENNELGKTFVTTDYDNNITSSLLVTSIDEEFMYLTPLWVGNELMRYMKISPRPAPTISLLLPFNFNSLSLNALVELFPLWGVVRLESGIKGEFDFTSSSISLLAQVGLKGTLPSSLFFSNKHAQRWYSHFSLIARTLAGIGVYIKDGVSFMYQGSISLQLQYQLLSSLAFSMGGVVNYSAYMPTKDSFVEDRSIQMVLGVSIVW